MMQLAKEYDKYNGFNIKLNTVNHLYKTIKKLPKKFQKQNLMNLYRVMTTAMIYMVQNVGH